MDDPKRARSWKRRIQPRVGLKEAEPVLYSTPAYSLPKNIQRPALLNLRREPFQEAILGVGAMLLLKFLPLFRLRRIDKVEHGSRIKTERAVIVFGLSSPISAGSIVKGFRKFRSDSRATRVGIRPASQQHRFNDLFEVFL